MSRNSEWQSAFQRREPERHAAKMRLYYARHRDRILATAKLRDPVKMKARYAASYAITTGRLVRGACAATDGTCLGAIQAHHDDYTKPLEVRWLCRSHHQRMHRAERAN